MKKTYPQRNRPIVRVSATIVAVMFFALTDIQATPQIPDYLIYNGQKFELPVDLLRPYTSTFKIKRVSKRKAKKSRGEPISSDLYRGYIATFEIVDSMLILKDVNRRNGESTLENFISNPKARKLLSGPEAKENGPIEIKWFTGTLTLEAGKYVRGKYFEESDFYLQLEFENGKFLKETRMNFLEFVKASISANERYPVSNVIFLENALSIVPKDSEYYLQIWELLKEEVVKIDRASESDKQDFLRRVEDEERDRD